MVRRSRSAVRVIEEMSMPSILILPELASMKRNSESANAEYNLNELRIGLSACFLLTRFSASYCVEVMVNGSARRFVALEQSFLTSPSADSYTFARLNDKRHALEHRR